MGRNRREIMATLLPERPQKLEARAAELMAMVGSQNRAALKTREFFDERVQRADRSTFDRIMSRTGDEVPRAGDEVPKGYRRTMRAR